LYFHLCQLQGRGGDAARGQAVGVGVCVWGIGLLFDIFGVPPGDGATYTLHHTAPHCNTLQHTLLSTMQKWRSFFLAIDSTGLLQTPFFSCCRFFCALPAANSSKTSGFLKPRFAWF